MTSQIINSQKQLDDYFLFLRAKLEKEGSLKIEVKSNKKRTLTQNAALHLYLANLSQALNENGHSCLHFFRDDFELDWTPDLCKSMLWKPLQDSLTGESSTSKADRKCYSLIYDHLNRFLVNKKDLFVPWPNEEDRRYGS